LTRDPAEAGRNWYVYCDNNPVSRIDADGLTPEGHHIIPKEIFKDGRVGAEAVDFFKGFTTGPIPGGHNYGDGHHSYNQAVKEEFAEFCKEKKIDPKKMSKKEAEEFAQRILKSKDPRITGFLAKIFAKIGKSVPKKVAQVGANKVAKKIATKVGKAVLKKIPIVGWLFVGYDVSTGGPAYAANEFLWPVSELWGGGG
jgi:hypothetical protein